MLSQETKTGAKWNSDTKNIAIYIKLLSRAVNIKCIEFNSKYLL